MPSYCGIHMSNVDQMDKLLIIILFQSTRCPHSTVENVLFLFLKLISQCGIDICKSLRKITYVIFFGVNT